VSVAAANAVEDKQWLVMLMGYGDDRPGRTIDAFRAACAELPPVYTQATAGAVTRDIVTYHQAESRRRHFTGLERFPARLAVVGDAVASFNPVYGQGMSSAALHGSCLSAYLAGDPDLTRPATDFFALQQLVVDAAWAVSAGGDSARLDALAGIEPPEDVRRQRWALQQVIGASIVDGSVARSFNDVSYMLRHPATLADPALLERAVAANQNAE
jgi:2-polyprenyl-6-methoxyphenol hydroxylase-like FAD-dependent oxidoreductase